MALESVVNSAGSLVDHELDPEPGRESEIDQQLQECQLCHMSQVNMQKHVFTVEHICKVKELLEQSSELYTNSNASGSDDNDSDIERRFYSLSKAFLLQQVASNVASSIMVPNRPPDTMCLMNYESASESRKVTTSTTLEDSGQTRKGSGAAGGGAIHRQLAAGDIDISVNDEGGEIVEVVKKNSTGNRPLMQQLYNRNHATGKICEVSPTNHELLSHAPTIFFQMFFFEL